MSPGPSAIVVGAGVLGAALAHRLALDGWAVTIVDQHPPGTMLGSSGGASRLIRTAHGDSREDALAAWTSLSLWRQIEAETGVTLLNEVGLTWLAGDDDRWERAGHAVLTELGVPAEVVALDQARWLFPDLRTDDLRYLLYEPRAALIAASEALGALVDGARVHGATFICERAARDGAAVLAGGRRLTADHIVWAVGSWTAEVFGELLRAHVIQQDTYYYAAPAQWSSPPVPAWSDVGAGITGAGDLGGAGVKVGLHEHGPTVELAGARMAAPELRAHARGYLRHRFPSLAAAPLVRSEVQHTAEVSWVAGVQPVAVIGGVRLVRDPSAPSVWILGDGSGSVFKTAPLAARTVASLLGG